MSKDCTSIIQKLQKHIQDKEQLRQIQSDVRWLNSESICPTFFNDEPKVYVDFKEAGVDLGLADCYRAFGYFSKESRRIVFVAIVTHHDEKPILGYPVDKADELYFQHISKSFVY